MARPLRRAVVIVTHKDSVWLKECLASLIGCKYPIRVVDGKSTFDPMGFYYGVEKKIREFVLIHDSVFIKDLKFLDTLFEIQGHVAFMPGFLSCLGKYVTEDLPPLPPQPMTKHQGVAFESGYCGHLQGHVMFPNLGDGNRFEEKNGRNNMIIENDLFIKFKGFWGPDMVTAVYGEH